jgi:hypothetical protein
MKIIFALVFSFSAYASDQIPDTDMHAVAREVMILQNFIFSSADFNSAANDSTINGSFEVLNRHLKHLGEKVFSEEPALRLNIALISSHISDADRSFKEGNKAYSRYMLQSSLQMCVACHTRTASPDFVLPEAELKNADPLQRGDFFFATRQFDKGRAAYESILSKSEKTFSLDQMRNATLSLAIYYARVKDDPKGGWEFFQKLAKDKKLTSNLRTEVKAWSDDFESWAKERSSRELTMTESELLKRARILLKGDREGRSGSFNIRRLRASALLHRVLETPGEKTPSKGQALLYLGQIYHRMQYQLFFRFGEMYLKACITDYKKEKIAQECYESLKQAVTKRVGAGSNKSTPGADEVELMRLKRLAF